MNTYLKSFEFPGEHGEFIFLMKQHMTCYNNIYPFRVLQEDFKTVKFEPITILYGGNGSGKSTVLNIIANKLGLTRSTKYNRSAFMENYTDLCTYYMEKQPAVAKILTSDDIFRSIFMLREQNDKIDEMRENAFDKRRNIRNSGMTANQLMNGESYIENFQKLKEINEAWSSTASAFAKRRIEENKIGKSNGETALEFFAKEITDGGLYLLDEPENSLSAVYQEDLGKFLWDSARFFGAQLIIATHSPFILSIPNAKIYNLDTAPVTPTTEWTTLENMQAYYRFFKSFEREFEENK